MALKKKDKWGEYWKLISIQTNYHDYHVNIAFEAVDPEEKTPINMPIKQRLIPLSDWNEQSGTQEQKAYHFIKNDWKDKEVPNPDYVAPEEGETTDVPKTIIVQENVSWFSDAENV